jgi:hypothetical protein
MATATRRRSQPALGWDGPSAYLPIEELDILRVWHPNVLIAGPIASVRASLDALRRLFRPVAVHWRAGLALPAATLHNNARTLIIEDVEALSAAEQQELLTWLKQNDRAVQVVATTSQPLLDLVQNGRFDAALFYALNVVHIRIPS